MSGWYVAYAAPGPATDVYPDEVAAELIRFPHNTFGRADHAFGMCAQAQRWYTTRDERAVLPHVSPDKPGSRVVLVGDLRLDESAALADRLGLRADATDPELVVAAYRYFGATAFTGELIGDFAFALVDEGTGSLVLARDAMGVRPLYLAQIGSQILASSDVAILAEHPSVTLATDERVLSEWILYGHVWHDTRTFFAGIKKLPRARADIFSCESRAPTVFWTPPQRARISRETYVARLAELLPESVAWRVDPSYPAAAHNSGGFDSGVLTTLTARIAAAAGTPCFSYNWMRPMPELEVTAATTDEWQPARRIAAEAATQHVEVGFTADDSLELLADYDIARVGTAMFEYETSLLRHAAAQDVRQVVSGYGGDELVTGHWVARLSDLALHGHWSEAWRQHAHSRSNRGPWARAFRFLPAVARDAAHHKVGCEEMGELHPRRDLGLPFVRDQMPFDNAILGECQAGLVALRNAGSLREHQLAWLALGHLTERLESWAALGRRAGIRHVYPLLDVRLVDLAISGTVDAGSSSCRENYHLAVERIRPAVPTPALKAAENLRVDSFISSVRASIEQMMNEEPASRADPLISSVVRLWQKKDADDDASAVCLVRDALLARSLLAS